jgi:LPS sulfotransferase NodH
MQKKTENTDEFLLNVFRGIDQSQSNHIKPIRKIAIFATPRSGSTYFCDFLRQTKIIGEPREWLNEKFTNAYAKYFKKQNINLKDYVDYIQDKTTSESGIFSIKILLQDYFLFLNKERFDLLSLGFDDIIFLSRHDKVAQAYSLAKASITNQWTSFIKPSQELNPDNIKNSDILLHLHRLVFMEELFESHVPMNTHLRYVYEDFIKQTDLPHKVLNDLKLNVSPKTKFNSQLEKQTTQNDLLRIEQLRKSLNLL